MLEQRRRGRRISTSVLCLLAFLLLTLVNVSWYRMEIAISEKKEIEAKLQKTEEMIEQLKLKSSEELASKTQPIHDFASMLKRVPEKEHRAIAEVTEIVSAPVSGLEISQQFNLSRTGVNHSGPMLGLPEACYNCRAGGGNGGMPLDEHGVCRHFCSMGRFCGTTGPYHATDCRQPCAGPACAWQLSTPQTGADVFWITGSLLPFDRASRRFDFARSECGSARGVDPQRDELWIDVGAHSAALAPARGLVLAFEPQLWLWQKPARRSPSRAAPTPASSPSPPPAPPARPPSAHSTPAPTTTARRCSGWTRGPRSSSGRGRRR